MATDTTKRLQKQKRQELSQAPAEPQFGGEKSSQPPQL